MGTLYEADIKELILDKAHMFGDLGNNVVLFEKALSMSKDRGVKKVIADCLVFSENRGVLGVEIKTERDSTQRLLRQLRSYALTCDFVYVACHDKHVAGVEKILKRHGFPFVGIMAYVEFKGTPMIGMYKEADRSPQKDVFHTLNMLWKVELLRLLSALKNPHKVILNETDPDSLDSKIPTYSHLKQNTYTSKMRKSQVIRELISWLGDTEANKVLCDVFINNRLDIARTIKLRHFNPKPRRDIDE